MSAGPLRRLVGVLGLLALLPTAALLTAGTVTVEDAAVRAGVTLLAALVLGKVAGWGLEFLAGEFDRAQGDGDRQPVTAGAVPRRRATDAVSGGSGG